MIGQRKTVVCLLVSALGFLLLAAHFMYFGQWGAAHLTMGVALLVTSLAISLDCR